MCKKLDNEAWGEYLNKFESIKDTITVKDFCAENNLNKNRKIFGASSEQVDANQLSFFNEAEKHSDSKIKEPTLEKITYIPAKLIIEEHVVYSYACKTCEKATGESKIISPEGPKTIFYNSMASNELIAHTLILKYQHAMPLYRQETYFDMMGATL